MSTFVLTDPLDFRSITNIFLYGQTTTPDLLNRIRSPNSPSDIVQIDASSFMGPNGPGRYALPSQSAFVQGFFSAASQGTFNGLPPALTQALALLSGTSTVSWTVAQLKTIGVDASLFSFSFQQRGWQRGTGDYAARTYIYNTERFSLSDSTVFTFDLNNPANSQVTNLAVLPAPDNFN